MKKSIILCAALLALASCKKNETEVKTENTVIEGPKDTIQINTDTIHGGAEAAPAETNEIKAEAPATAAKVEVLPTPRKDADLKPVTANDYASFGDKITADKALSKDQMLKKYASLKAGDTINVKFSTKINEVCKKKGCWMSLELPGGKESFVKFKDYAFFVPLNADGQQAIVSGKAFVSEISVSQLRHYAKDGGKSEAEIAKITEPETTYGFLADGVLISK
ncbi:MAG: DUF4920 domain-containing protein [Bacteroidota bacterium]